MADTGDNPGGGATGDATFLLRACLDRGLTGIAFAIFHDREAVAARRASGGGATIDLRLGGGWPGLSGPAIDLSDAKLLAIGSGMEQDVGGVMMPMGDAAAIECRGIHIVLNDVRTQVFDPACLTGLGLEPASFRAIVVKSLNHFTALFAPLVGETLISRSSADCCAAPRAGRPKAGLIFTAPMPPACR